MDGIDPQKAGLRPQETLLPVPETELCHRCLDHTEVNVTYEAHSIHSAEMHAATSVDPALPNRALNDA